jgi:N-carbamoyl-L-amino-acid hydrolase
MLASAGSASCHGTPDPSGGTMPAIDADRLLADLRHLRTFGATGPGVVRPSLSPVDMAARRWLASRMTDAGLDAAIDGVGNVVGRARKPGPALLLGSHSDTQPRGGWLDGALGVIYAVEVARALAEAPETADLAVDAVSWVDEEGTYLGFLGSLSFCGLLEGAAVDAAESRDGHPLRDAIREAGLTGTAPARIDPERHVAYLEAHIEQGGHLEATGRLLGVVTAIVGIRTFRIAFTGSQNHAGTTPMPIRRDAGRGLIDLAHRVNAEFPALAGERTVWTMGRAVFDPGAPSIIPGRAELTLQFRDPEDARLDALEQCLDRLIAEATARGPVEVEIVSQRDHIPSCAMDEGLSERIAAAAERHAPGLWTRMPSGAGHDAMVLARRVPSAMLFVPSIGGISHDFAEDTADDDIVLGCQVLATAAADILAARRS